MSAVDLERDALAELARLQAQHIAEARKARVTKALVLREIERQRRLGHVNDYGAERITAAALAAVDGAA